jgi:hypothetical protein
MANDAIVLQDSGGHYYVLPQETLNDARVSDDAKSAVDEDLGDVQGFSLSFSFVGGISPTDDRIGNHYQNTSWPCDAS